MTNLQEAEEAASVWGDYAEALRQALKTALRSRCDNDSCSKCEYEHGHQPSEEELRQCWALMGGDDVTDREPDDDGRTHFENDGCPAHSNFCDCGIVPPHYRELCPSKGGDDLSAQHQDTAPSASATSAKSDVPDSAHADFATIKSALEAFWPHCIVCGAKAPDEEEANWTLRDGMWMHWHDDEHSMPAVPLPNASDFSAPALQALDRLHGAVGRLQDSVDHYAAELDHAETRNNQRDAKAAACDALCECVVDHDPDCPGTELLDIS